MSLNTNTKYTLTPDTQLPVRGRRAAGQMPLSFAKTDKSVPQYTTQKYTVQVCAEA